MAPSPGPVMNPRLKYPTVVACALAFVGAAAAQNPDTFARLSAFPSNPGDSAYALPQTVAVAAISDNELPEAPSARFSTSKDHGEVRNSTTMLSDANWRPLTTKEKFKSTSDDLLDPFTQMSLLAGAKFSQATNDRPYLGPGTAGFFRRYGLDVADTANVDFIQGSLLPWAFHEDPRYLPLDEGSRTRRTWYALSRSVIARKDSGRDGFSEAKVFGAFASSGISNIYYPGERDNCFRSTSIRAVSNIGTNAAMNVLKEFWPDVARKVKLNVWLTNVIEKTIRTTTNSD